MRANRQHFIFKGEARASKTTLQPTDLRDALIQTRERGRAFQMSESFALSGQQFLGEAQ